jgi:2-dehydropantoate 2-reductase
VGPVDVVFLGVKAHSLPQLAPQLKTVLAPDTTVVSTQNGVPWWFFENFAGDWNGLRLERVDPGGVISAAIEARRVIGSIVYFSTEVIRPGVIRHIEGNRISLGEPDGTRSERLRRIADTLVASGLRAPITAHIRNEIWVKLLGNIAFNPLSALTGATLGQMVRDPDVSNLAREIMREAQAVAARLGLDLPISIDQRMEGAKKVGEHKTSMLQDLEAHRPLELEAIVGAIVELGQRIGVPMPHTRTIYSATKLLAECRNLAPRAHS